MEILFCILIYLGIGLLTSIPLIVIRVVWEYYHLSELDTWRIHDNLNSGRYAEAYLILFDYMERFELKMLIFTNTLFWFISFPFMLLWYLVIGFKEFIYHYTGFEWSTIPELIAEIFYRVILFPIKLIRLTKVKKSETI